jgi:hypothetical protein
MHLKVFLKLKKTLKTLSSGQIYKKTKNPKKPKKNHCAGFFFKPGFFPTLVPGAPREPQLRGHVLSGQ